VFSSHTVNSRWMANHLDFFLIILYVETKIQSLAMPLSIIVRAQCPRTVHTAGQYIMIWIEKQ